MTDRQTEALKLALEALEFIRRWGEPEEGVLKRDEAITAIREALAEQPAQQEPYAWMAIGGTIWRHKTTQDDVPLYTTLPHKPWVGLTEEEIEKTAEQVGMFIDKYGLAIDAQNGLEDGVDIFGFARAIEAKLREKNA